MNKKEYQEYLQSDHWKELRARKKRAVGRVRCAICSSTEKVQTHHLQYKNIYDVVLDDLRLLCERCHNLVHQLIEDGRLDPTKYKNSNAIYNATKAAVKKALGVGTRRMFP